MPERCRERVRTPGTERLPLGPGPDDLTPLLTVPVHTPKTLGFVFDCVFFFTEYLINLKTFSSRSNEALTFHVSVGKQRMPGFCCVREEEAAAPYGEWVAEVRDEPLSSGSWC
jgi:hypothetical protein